MNNNMTDRKRALGEKNLREWDQLHCLVHDDALVIHTAVREGKVIKYLGFKENKQTEKAKEDI